MPQARPDLPRKARPADAVAARQRQLDAFSAAPEGPLTTDQGVVIPDNHGSLRAGERGPTLLEDFILREKLAHFEHERIPERVVFARGCAAHGWFETYRSLSAFTRADFLQEPGGRTPVFVRFSNLTGERGSADTVRDLRGFAVKFYTREGNFDLVGASFPVAFVQDAMKFPDFAHALKPAPHHGMPQASSAHDGFWDFCSLMPETTHALMWLMSGHALPRSLRMMAGYGVHTFRLVNAHGTPHFAKFHWRPRLGRHALGADEARRIAGRDPDFLRRDLWEAVARGPQPEWELGLQLIEEDRAGGLGIDLLDPTKLVPEEVLPVQAVGKLVLHRNPDNFFAEAEQVAFHPGHLVPGIDFSHDPLLQGRLAAYTGAQVSRLGGPNGSELPVNRPVCPVHALHRDGAGRISIAQGVAHYEPNTLAQGGEFRVDGGQQGFRGADAVAGAAKLRCRPASFDDHFSQATLLWNSLSPMEREQLVAAFQWELAQVEAVAIRQRVVDNLAHVDARLARKVAEPLGLGTPDPRAAAGRAGFREAPPARGEPLERSPSLSLDAPAPGIASRRIAILVAHGVEIGAMRVLQQALHDAGAVTRVVAAHLGFVSTSSGQQLAVDHALAAAPSVLFDAVMVPAGASSAQALAASGDAVHFVLEAFRHGKALCLIGEGAQLLRAPGGEAASAPGVVTGRNDPATRLPMAQEFMQAIARHRHWGRPGAEAVPA
ncbi:catalase [Ramlibacter sp. MAHUQ-53]|uniref:catalase n=1 Tax=unclassified Ramlibacter TaxID=2617605 RepID=UPI003639A54A